MRKLNSSSRDNALVLAFQERFVVAYQTSQEQKPFVLNGSHM